MGDGWGIQRLLDGDSEAEDGVMAIHEDRVGHLWVWRDLSGIARYRSVGAGLEDAGLPPPQAAACGSPPRATASFSSTARA